MSIRAAGSSARPASVVALGLVALASLTIIARCDGSAKGGFALDGGEGGAIFIDGQFLPADTGVLTGQDGGGPQVDAGPCVHLECNQQVCPGGGTTTITGAVYDPAGKNPLYDVVVYVPNGELQPIPSGPGCDSCDSLFSGDPLVATTTGADGTFVLKNVPSGSGIPIVVQIGKWRAETKITVAPCVTNVIEPGGLRLPSNHSDPLSNIPQIAISTGGADSLECLLIRVGLDPSEYTSGAGGAGHIHIFQGAGELASMSGAGSDAPTTETPAPQSYQALWDKYEDLSLYDILLLSCEGQETSNMDQRVLYEYTSKGGRVFASHYHYAWFDTGPFGTEGLADWTVHPGTMQLLGNQDMIYANVVTSFPKGGALKTWLLTVGALEGGELAIQEPRYDAIVVGSSPSQAWLTSDEGSGDPGAAEYFSFNTPVGRAPAEQCGRVVFSDIHVGGASNDYTRGMTTVPAGCTRADLSPQEKALEFMLFDLSSCVSPDSQPPPPPPSGPPK